MDLDELPCEVPIWSVAGNPVAGGPTKVDRVLDIIRFEADQTGQELMLLFVCCWLLAVGCWLLAVLI